MVLGVGFLLGVPEGTSRASIFIAFLLVAAGAFCAAFAVKLNKRPAYLFFAALFMMTGFFLFLSALGVIDLPIARTWPLLSVFSGLALIPMGWRRYGSLRMRYIVSSAAFVILGGALLAFSLQIIPFSFRQFVYNWWPLLLVFGGLNLALISLGSRRSE